MSEIDVQNAKQIRDPMDVLITMEVPDESITLTYSGYSSAKVADGVLGQSAWPMRLLADLQGEGFPLDGSRVLYDSSTSASEADGKIGVRSNIGQTVSVTVTGNKTITNLSIYATGAESVTYNGTTSAIVGGVVVIPVQARTVTLTFNPANETQRIEVSGIIAGTVLTITNENLVKCVVSLRADLSIIDPSLPESEINIEAYNDADISETVANLPEETPITYQAGYPGDMSPVRKFYVSGQVTWKDNVLSIQAVDAVHLLDVDTFPFIIGSLWGGTYSPASQKGGPYKLYSAFADQIRMSGIGANIQSAPSFDMGVASSVYRTLSLCERQSRRDLIANMMNLFRMEQKVYSGSSVFELSYWLNYVDAGIPTVTWGKPTASATILEEDCGDVEKNAEPKIGTIVYEGGEVVSSGASMTLEIGGGTLLHGSKTVFPDYPDFCESMLVFAVRESDSAAYNVMSFYEDGSYSGWPSMLPLKTQYGDEDFYYNSYGKFLIDGDVGTNGLAAEYFSDSPRVKVPWEELSYRVLTAAVYNNLVNGGYISADESSSNLVMRGRNIILNKTTVEEGRLRSGITVHPSKTHWYGTVCVVPFSGSEIDMVAEGFSNLLARGRITGSFTWKGDPRLQPRDVVKWQRLNGRTEDITLEEITLTHENGGTSADIKFRKGIV